MIYINEKKKGDLIWVVKQSIDEMIYPVKAEYHSLESPTSTKLAFINLNQKRICYPTNLLFETKEEAEIYAIIVFLKMYYSFDPFTIADDILPETLQLAHELANEYEETHPDKFLYHWMQHVPNR